MSICSIPGPSRIKSQSISVYLSGLRHLQVSAGFQPPQRAEWPRLQYILKGIAHQQPHGPSRRLPITAAIMSQLQTVLPQMSASPYEASMMWAACCLGYFGFMRSGEFTADRATEAVVIAADVAVDSHTNSRLSSVRQKQIPLKKG